MMLQRMDIYGILMTSEHGGGLAPDLAIRLMKG